MRLASKHRREFSSIFTRLDGGVNYSVPAEAIANNELSGALNFFYDPYTFRPMKRPGIAQYSTGTATGSSINGIHRYISTAANYTVCSSNGTLYYLDLSRAFTSIGSITFTGRPTFMDFNDKVLIANGNLWSWDGTTLTNLTSANTAPKTSFVSSWGGRVLTIGDTDYPHQVKFSGPGDETDWDTSGGNAERFDIDYLVGEGVVGGNVLGNNIIVFKGPQQRGTHRLIIPDGDFTAAYVEPLSDKISCLNMQSSMRGGNNLFFLDNDGFKSIRGLVEYGDLGVEPTGSKINMVILDSINADYAMLFDFPYYNQIWIKYAESELMYVFNPVKGSFMPVKFPGYIVQSAEYLEEDKLLLLGMDDGHIYKLDPTSDQDAGSDYSAFIRTKRISGPQSDGNDGVGSLYEKLLKYSFIEYEGSSAGAMTVEAIVNGGESTVTLLTETLVAASSLIYGDTEEINADTDDIYSTATNYEISRIQVPYNDLQFQVSINSGAAKINKIEGSSAIIGRR